jgi:hypothetical protein
MVVLGVTWREDRAKAERIVENPLTSVWLPDDIFTTFTLSLTEIATLAQRLPLFLCLGKNGS